MIQCTNLHHLHELTLEQNIYTYLMHIHGGRKVHLQQVAQIVQTVWPDLVIYWTLGKFSKPFTKFSLPKSPTFLGNFCKRVKTFHFSCEIPFGQLLYTFGDFLLVTLNTNESCQISRRHFETALKVFCSISPDLHLKK